MGDEGEKKMIKTWFMKNLVVILAVLLAVSIATNITQGIVGYFQSNKIEKLNVELGVVAGLSQNQEVKIVESKVIEEKIHVVTQDRIKMLKEYVIDENKSDAENGIAIMRRVF